MATINRRAPKPDRLTMKQVAKIILMINGTSPGYKEQIQPKFKIRETVVQQIIGMPLADSERKTIVRELNLLGWDVAINSEYWLVFTHDGLQNWHDAGTFIPHSLIEELQDNPEPEPLPLAGQLNLTPNEVAKFFGYSEDDIRDELVANAYISAPENVIEEFDETEDESILGIQEGDQLPVYTFTFWQYIDYYLAKKALNRKAPLIL